MRTCPTCNNEKTKQTTSILTRILLSAYVILSFLFFTGGIDREGLLLAIIPLVIPYSNKCLKCNRTFIRTMPKWTKASVSEVNTIFDRYLLVIFPSILMIALLITCFPNTGLGRILYLPAVFFVNSAIFIICLSLTINLKRTISAWTLMILTTLIFTIALYPQENADHVIKQIWISMFS